METETTKPDHCHGRYCTTHKGPHPCACGCDSCLFVRSHEAWPEPAAFLDASLTWAWKKENEREQTHVTAYGRTSVWPNDVHDVQKFLRAHGFTFDVVHRDKPSQGFWEITVTGWATPVARYGIYERTRGQWVSIDLGHTIPREYSKHDADAWVAGHAAEGDYEVRLHSSALTPATVVAEAAPLLRPI